MEDPLATEDQPAFGRPLTMEDVRSRKKPPVETVLISDDSALSQAYHEAQSAVEDAKRLADLRGDESSLVKLEEAETALADARRDIEPHLMRFRVRSIGRDAYEELVDKHPASKDQRAEARRRTPGRIPIWNDDTFPPALIAACCVEPEMTEVDAKELWTSGDWSSGDCAALFAACVQVNQAVGRVDLGKGSSSTRA